MAGRGTDLPFVGRDEPLRLLHAWLREARNGQGRFVTVVGPAGIGKSRLLEELAASPEHVGVTLSAACAPGDPPFQPWRTILARAVELAGGHASPSPQGDDPGAVADVLLETWAALPAPVLAVIDDLHDADAASLQLLHRLRESVADEPVLIAATLRAPRSAATGSSVVAPIPDAEVVLAGLGAVDIRTLLRRHRNVDASGRVTSDLDAEAAQLLATTGGNPLALATLLAAEGMSSIGGQILGPDHPGSGTARERPAPVDDPLLQALGQLDGDGLALLRLLALVRQVPAASLAALAGLDRSGLEQLVTRCDDLGLLTAGSGPTDEPALHPRAADLLLRGLSVQARASLHARIAEHLARDRSVPATIAAHHAVEAAGQLPPERLGVLAEQGGLEALAQGAFDDAERFLAVAQDTVAGPDGDARRLRALLGRTEARQRGGDLPGASTLALRAARLAQALGDADGLAEAAVRYAYPVEWRTGDPEASALLASAEAARPGPRWLAQVLAVRAVVEMRLPVVDADGEQWHWVTRPEIGQPLAERALSAAQAAADSTAMVMALLAWRSNHRAPGFLERRRQASSQAQQLAQRLGRLDLVVEAGLRLAVDELEAGNRIGFDEELGVVRWAADRSGEPRLQWRAACLEASRAIFDGDVDGLAAYRRRAREAAHGSQIPGALVADQLFGMQLSLLSGDLDELSRLLSQDHPGATHQLGQAAAALAAAALGLRDETARRLEGLPWPLDPESSLLLTATLAGRAAARIEDGSQAARLLSVLGPWRAHVAVDAECMWPAIPVAAVTAQLRRLLGDLDAAEEDHAIALRSSQVLRSPAVAAVLDHPAGEQRVQLTARQVAVLRGLAAGRSNSQLALDLRFSLATIRRETSAIYRMLRVNNRAEAVNEAHRLGLIEPRPMRATDPADSIGSPPWDRS